jgi:hypothetical protein
MDVHGDMVMPLIEFKAMYKGADGRYKGVAAPLRPEASVRQTRLDSGRCDTIQQYRYEGHAQAGMAIPESLKPSYLEGLRCKLRQRSWKHGMVHYSNMQPCQCTILVRLEPLLYKRAQSITGAVKSYHLTITHSHNFLKLCNLVPRAIQKRWTYNVTLRWLEPL